MNIAYLDRQVCKLFNVEPDKDLCEAPKAATQHKPKDFKEFKQKPETRMSWAWDRFALYILNKVYEEGIVPRGGYVTPPQLLTTVKNLPKNTPFPPTQILEFSKLFTWFNSQDYLLRAS